MIDFRSITSTTSRYNFHCHTQYCDGHASIEDFVREAEEEGFEHIGFTPHSPMLFETTCNMKRDDVDAYRQEIERMRKLYGDRINIYYGMEIDYTDQFGASNSYYKSLGLDFSIGSVHFIPAKNDENLLVDIDGRFPNFKKKMGQYFDNDIEWVVRKFYEQSMKMVECGGFDIVGHFDKIGFNASQFQDGIDDEPWYDKLVLTLFEAILDHHYAVEINTKSWLQHNRFFANIKYFSMLKESGVTIVVNSDSHYPTLINSGRDEAIRLLKAL